MPTARDSRVNDPRGYNNYYVQRVDLDKVELRLRWDH